MSKSTAVVNFREQLKAQLAEVKKNIDAPVGAPFISTKGKVFTLPDGESSNTPMSVVVLDFVNSFSYFEKAYNSKKLEPPVCSAVGRVLEDMAPKADVDKPQADACQGCPHNEFADDNGPKACKQNYTLAIVAPNSIGTEDAQVLRINVSPSARRYWSSYMRDLQKQNLHPAEVVTEISFDDDSDYPLLKFKMLGPNPKLDETATLFEAASGILLGRGADKAKAA